MAFTAVDPANLTESEAIAIMKAVESRLLDITVSRRAGTERRKLRANLLVVAHTVEHDTVFKDLADTNVLGTGSKANPYQDKLRIYHGTCQ